MAWVYLDDHFPDHPKVAAAGGDAGWLYICGLAYVKRYATEGTIPKTQVPRLSDRKAPTRLARRLVEVGLWHDEGDHYRIHDYREWNKPQESRSAAARKAAKARWSKDAKRNANASANAPPDAHADASADASESHSDRIESAHASGCPPPHTPTDENTSSYGLTTPAHPPDDDDHQPAAQTPPDLDFRIGATLATLAERDLTDRQQQPHLRPVGDPTGWQNRAYDQRRQRHGTDIETLASEHPDATPGELADMLEPPPDTITADGISPPTAAPRPPPVEAVLAASRGPDPDPQRNVTQIRQLRAGLRQPQPQDTP